MQSVDLFLSRLVALLHFDWPTDHCVDRRSERQHTEVAREQAAALEDDERHIEPGGQSLLESRYEVILRIAFDVVHVVLAEHDHRH